MISLVDKAQDGDLLRRIKGIRKKFTQDVGFLPPPVHIRIIWSCVQTLTASPEGRGNRQR